MIIILAMHNMLSFIGIYHVIVYHAIYLCNYEHLLCYRYVYMLLIECLLMIMCTVLMVE